MEKDIKVPGFILGGGDEGVGWSCPQAPVSRTAT